MLKLFIILSMEKSYYPRIFSIDLNVNQCDYYLISAAILERFGHFLIGFGCTRSGSPNKSCVDQCQWYEEKNSLWVKINDLKKDTHALIFSFVYVHSKFSVNERIKVAILIVVATLQNYPNQGLKNLLIGMVSAASSLEPTRA